QDNKYRVGAVLLDVTDLDHVLSRLDEPILEPVAPYEVEGDRPDTVFPCGVILIGETLFVYYGGADKYTAVATIEFKKLLNKLT
ncbi:glycosidase, partial [Candidatus Roizmanbacteria bacterium]|nr:glycosidase [Candidatus Roizmanbacteria bacterium]